MNRPLFLPLPRYMSGLRESPYREQKFRKSRNLDRMSFAYSGIFRAKTPNNSSLLANHSYTASVWLTFLTCLLRRESQAQVRIANHRIRTFLRLSQKRKFLKNSRNAFMSNINRAIIQIPAFIVIAGIIVAVNWVYRPEPPTAKNPRQLPPKIIIEHAQEEMGRIRAELESIKENADYAKATPEPPPEAVDASGPPEAAPM